MQFNGQRHVSLILPSLLLSLSLCLHLPAVFPSRLFSPHNTPPSSFHSRCIKVKMLCSLHRERERTGGQRVVPHLLPCRYGNSSRSALEEEYDVLSEILVRTLAPARTRWSQDTTSRWSTPPSRVIRVPK